MNETIKTILERKSCRSFKNEQITDDELKLVIDAGLAAPSGRNLQPTIIVAVQDKETIAKMSRINAAVMESDSDPFYGAPVVLVVLADKTASTHVYDGSIVMQNMMLTAHSLGLGSCWIHRARETFEQPKWQQYLRSLGIEGEYVGIGNCIVGYGDIQPQEKPRKENWVYYIDEKENN